MLRATLRSLFARKLRLVLSGIAIILGVAFVAGSLVLTDTMGKVFDNLFAKVEANVSVVVRGVESDVSDAREPVPASVLPKIRAVDGVKQAVGEVGGFAQLVDAKGKTYPYHPGPPALGFNYDGGSAVSSVELSSGSAPTKPDEIVIDATTAKNTHYATGDTAPVITRLGRESYHIVGVFTAGGEANQGGASVTLFTQHEAQRLFGRPGEYQNISIAADPGVSDGELTSRVAQVLPEGTEAVTGTQDAQDTADQIQEGLGFFRTFLLVFAGVALFVGAFIIFNTFSMLVGQRSRELAMFRALGASRGQVTRSVLVEAVVVGLIATTIGLGLGVVVAIAIRALIEWSFGGNLPGGSLVFERRTFIVTYLVGVVITALAALVPAWRASRIPPMAALREAGVPDTSRKRGLIVGAVLLGLGIVGIVFGLRGELGLLGIGAVLVFLGVTAVAPVAVPAAVAILGAPFRRAVPGTLGRRNARRNPRRTSTTAGALMIGVALISAVSVLGASVKTSVGNVIDQAFAADFSVQDKNFLGLPPTIAAQLDKQPDIGQTDALAFSPALVDGDKVDLTAAPNQAIGSTIELAKQQGSLTLEPDVVLVDQKHFDDNNWSLGQAVRVQYERGPEHPLTIGGVYKDNALVGPYLVDETERKWFEERLDGVLLVKGAPGVPLDDVRQTIDQVIKPYPNAKILTRQEFIDQQAGFIDILISIITGLLVFSVVIALIGIVNTLALSIFERTRELGLLRAVGLSRKQMRRMVRVEAVIVALFGGLLGLIVGTALGVAIVKALGSEGLDDLAFPWLRMVLLVIFAALAGVIAAIWPARRAAKLNVLDAIATE